MARKSKRTYEVAGVDLHAGAWENMSKQELARLAAHEAKIANQRQRRLDAAGMGSGSNMSPAYKVVKSDISRWFPGASKFSERAGVYEKMRVSTIKAILRDLEYYKTLKTATVKGVKQVMKRRQKAFEKSTGVKFKSEAQFRRFWESGAGKMFFNMLGSKEAITYIKQSSKDLDEIIKEAEAFISTDDGDKDNADRVAQILGYKNLADARKQARSKGKQSASKKGGKNDRKSAGK